jgi:hypothetical protein
MVLYWQPYITNHVLNMFVSNKTKRIKELIHKRTYIKRIFVMFVIGFCEHLLERYNAALRSVRNPFVIVYFDEHSL